MTRFFIYMYFINDRGGSLAILVLLIVWNSGYRPTLKTLNTPGTKVVGGHWRGYTVRYPLCAFAINIA
jgi:hypothetical protein